MTLKKNLHVMRKAIDNFYGDQKRYPSELLELVPTYVREIPLYSDDAQG